MIVSVVPQNGFLPAGAQSGAMPLEVACSSCGARFDAALHAGLVRCAPCVERQAFRVPSAGPTVTVLDTPGEAWA